MTATDRVAILVVHGIADQKPGQTVREVARLLCLSQKGAPKDEHGTLPYEQGELQGGGRQGRRGWCGRRAGRCERDARRERRAASIRRTRPRSPKPRFARQDRLPTSWKGEIGRAHV